MAHDCACGRPAPDTMICTSCCGRLERALADIPALAAELDVVLARLTVYADRPETRASVRPLPVDLAASEAGWVLRNTLAGWVRTLEEG